ncbi:MAG: DJ-1/PfpI family protein [Candidatus Improbicoccus devescovinae]|nr:MAG: DJ-1/PfpI family protein [Candidatus Improbicoccus devescovinae]
MVYVFLADGFEDLEAIAPIDILKRAKFDVKTVGVSVKNVQSCMGTKLEADISIDEILFENLENLELIVLPGGSPGAENLGANTKVCDIIKHCVTHKILIGAICAAPVILGKLNFLENIEACCFPGCEKYLKNAKLSEDYVCNDNKIITARGPGVANEFAFELVAELKGKKDVQKIRKFMQFSG